MKRKFRRKHYVVEAEPYTQNGEIRGWVVTEEGQERSYTVKDFEALFEEVSMLHRTSPLTVDIPAEGAD